MTAIMARGTGRADRRQGGFTLIEAAFVLAIAAIILAVAVPNYSSLQQRKQLQAAGDALAQDMRNARELAVSGSTPVFLNFHAVGKAWCWGVSSGTPCDCTSNAPVMACNVNKAASTSYSYVQIDNGRDAVFTPGRGEVAEAGATEMHTAKGMSLQVVLNPLGRASLCGKDSRSGQAC